MPPLINVRSISKAFGAEPLFQNVSFTVSEGDRIGLIGPNGSGKSTLLRILAGSEDTDDGEIAVRKRLRLSYVEQESEFERGATVRSVVDAALRKSAVPESERGTRFAETLGRAEFVDLDAEAAALSGGWQKRLAIVEALVQGPDILLLDEPTNHLDLAGIEWLEEVLEQAPFACVVISHDRYFLENVATDMAELSRVYPDGILRVKGRYSEFLEKKEEFLHAQSKRQEALENLVHSEIEWLRRGAKARTRKSKARIDKAGELMEELADLNTRTRTSTAQIDFSATDRKTKRLIELQGVSYEIGGRRLFQGLNFIITAGLRVGLVGPNGSGKTTLLRLIRGEVAATAGEIRRAEKLRIVYFDQRRELDPNVTLRRALAPEGDSVIYRGRFGRVGHAHHRPHDGIGVLWAFDDHEQDGRTREEFHQVREEWALRMLGIVRLRKLRGDCPQLRGDESQVLAFQPSDDLADQSALNAVGLYNYKGSIHERRTVAAAHARDAALDSGPSHFFDRTETPWLVGRPSISGRDIPAPIISALRSKPSTYG